MSSFGTGCGDGRRSLDEEKLYADPAFLRQVRNEVDGDNLRLTFHLAPPLLARRNRTTGEPVKMGTYADATDVREVDSIGLVNIVHRLNYGRDLGSNAIGGSTNFTIGVNANPGDGNIENELRRFAFKVDAGAEYAITQPVFDLRILEQFLKRIEDFRIPVIAGIWPLTSLRNAEFMKNDLRVSMPDSILARMAEAAGKKAALAIGLAIAQEMLAEVRDQGPGFDPSRVPDPLAVENLEREGGRGLHLMRAYMSWVRYNDTGNCVTLCKRRAVSQS